MVLVAAVLVIIMVSLVGIFLQAELNEQAKLKVQNEGPTLVQATPTPQSPRRFWSRSDKTSTFDSLHR